MSVFCYGSGKQCTLKKKVFTGEKQTKITLSIQGFSTEKQDKATVLCGEIKIL